MNRAEKRDFWNMHLADWSNSGLSQKAYCAQHELTLATFSYWRKLLRSKASPPKLIPMARSTRVSAVRVTVSGVHMEVPVECLEQVLPVLWRSLRETH